VYDTQLAFSFERNAYPIPDLLAACDWIEVHTSTFRAREPLGKVLGNGRSNQNLERLTFPDAYFDLVVTSDVMEHVRLPERAHSEIRRVLGSGGVYLFTVPHFRDPFETMVRVTVVDPDDPSRDAFLMEPEYHGDVNCEDNAALSYRVFGRDIDGTLERLGFRVEYSKDDVADTGIRNTELFYCRVVSSPDTMAADAR
jgi:SAM-dependent methyltransferase